MFQIITTPTFEKNTRKIAKRDKLLHIDLQNLFDILLLNPREGKPIGNSCYKIRVKNSSAKKGKSGGYRVISYCIKEDKIGLLTIYSKSERENIFQNEIDALIAELDKKISSKT
jgi:mRNA-degrading endonuclease RelE of RelBE toxin-antitoxin system